MENVYRPAWRSQWVALCITILLFALSIFVLIRFGLMEKGTNPYFFTVAPLFAIILLIIILYRRASWKYTITEKTIESRYGIISRTVRSIRIRDLRNINVKQSLFQRVLGVGDVEFSSAGGPDMEVIFLRISNPMDVKEKVQALQGSGE